MRTFLTFAMIFLVLACFQVNTEGARVKRQQQQQLQTQPQPLPQPEQPLLTLNVFYDGEPGALGGLAIGQGQGEQGQGDQGQGGQGQQGGQGGLGGLTSGR